MPILFTLYTDGYYGTERMTIAIALALQASDVLPIIVSPPGRAVAEARAKGLTVLETAKAASDGSMRGLDFRGFGAVIGPFLRDNPRLGIVSSHPGHSLAFAMLNVRYRRATAQIFVAHGVPDVSLQTRTVFNTLPMRIVAISSYSRERLLRSGVKERRVCLVENFLSADQVAGAPQRPPFECSGIQRVAIVSRIQPVKRIELLLTCLENRPDLSALDFHIYGSGRREDGTGYFDALCSRASERGLRVHFEGYRTDVAEQLARSDLLLHLNPTEPFGLVVLEAMAAGIPVLVPDRGGAASIVEEGVNGRHFVADDDSNLGNRLIEFANAPPELLNQLVAGGRASLESRFSEAHRIADYRRLLSVPLA
jgi:hypothetical protein